MGAPATFRQLQRERPRGDNDLGLSRLTEGMNGRGTGWLALFFPFSAFSLLCRRIVESKSIKRERGN